MEGTPEKELAAALLPALRPDFGERETTARQLAELLLDAISAALPLTRHEPAEAPLAQLEALAQQVDVYSWDGAPGWDVVLSRGLARRSAVQPGPSVLDGLGARAERTQQRGELKRRAHAQAERLVERTRNAALEGEGGALVAAHAALLRLVGCAAASSLLILPEDVKAGPLPPFSAEALEREMDERAAAGSEFAAAQEEWLATLLAQNPAAAQAPLFRTFFAGLSQSLRVAVALREFRDAARAGSLAPDCEAILGALGTWQPVRWSALRSGAPPAWIAELCPAAPARETDLQRLERECSSGLDLAGRLWFARGLSLTAFTALAALLVARCASAVAVWQELGGGAEPA
jgi:hypothetical protein